MAPSRSVRARALLASLLLLLLAETDALHLALASRGATRLLVCARRPAALVMETMETKTREGVVSKGHPHTEESRMKISRANKGKKPWNVGKKHSEETKRKIALKTREAYLRRKEAEETRLRTEEPEKWAAMLDGRVLRIDPQLRVNIILSPADRRTRAAVWHHHAQSHAATSRAQRKHVTREVRI